MSESEIFKELLSVYFVPCVTKYFKNPSIKDILLTDNAPTHPEDCEMTKASITARFLVQLRDLGVFQRIKAWRVCEQNNNIKNYGSSDVDINNISNWLKAENKKITPYIQTTK